ncbi:class I SAM-dependent methyltransferase [Metabacillus idriensis]|uniref:Methyltransferase n=1 Tax=Metabacillus idriensis TaxID=324768 RepID=A0A6I2MG98_9BACI|nr:class I SAM-dependent methyltransferase [Metabacillus idriensis]MCM3598888.1 class I SAM-dependent methyltransferase [Metabacillus idriensis]MRX56819.1 methyltransferase [Metabacillus idriensis]OHR63513.1 16S rRNA methyltransferase [Bacillus sp. HMSC76G11]
MTNHYYSSQPEAESNRKSWTFTLRGNSFHFQSDRGVFSKNEVDFGSRLLIETFTLPDQKGDLLDVGCGYGPIGISLAKEFKDLTVDMIDVNERAVELAKVNAEANGVKNVRIIASNLFENVDPSKKYAAVLTNPPIRAGKKVVHEIFEKSFESLLPGGELWVVIQKKQGAPSAIAKLDEMFKEVVTVKKDKGYFIIRAEKD